MSTLLEAASSMLFRSFRPGLRPLVILGSIALAACDSQQTDVKTTIPRNNEGDVDPRTVIAIEFSNSFTSADDTVTEGSNVTVTGDLSTTPYQGTLVIAKRSDVFRGQTVEEFTPSGDGGEGETSRKNTLVFLLQGETQFKDGETIQVHVRDDVTSHGSPIRSSRRFTFRVRGESEDAGSLLVTSTDPEPWDFEASPRPRIAGAFSRAVKQEGLADAIVVRGSESGVHAGGDTLPARVESQGKVLEVVRRLAVDDGLLPGEFVSVAWGSAITAASSSAGTSPAKLSPFLLRFQVKPGLQDTSLPGSQAWKEPLSFQTVSSPLGVVTGDFLPLSEGVEVAVIGKDAVGLYFQIESRAWTSTESSLDLADQNEVFEPVAGAAYDVSGSGAMALVLLLSSATKSRVAVYEASESGGFSVVGKPVDIPASRARGLAVADLDGNGKPELLVSHPVTTYVPTPGQAARKTGNLTFLELKLIPPDPDDINPADPETFLPKPGFAAVENPIKDFPLASRIEAQDLDGDGKLDLVSEVDNGLAVHRNLGSANAQFAFRSGGFLAGRSSGALRPLAWTVADMDGDRHADVFVLDSQGALFYPDLSGPDLPEPEEVAGFPIQLQGPASATVLDVDGDGAVDLVVSEKGRQAAVLLGETGFPAASTRVDLAGVPPEAGVATADLDGDTGLDFAVLSAGDPSIRFHLSDVDEPSVVSPTTFRFAPEGAGTDLDAEVIRIEVRGDIKELFAGFTVALDYDERVLEYRGFEIPDAFERGTSFTLCPDAALQGCSGNASAKMSYLQGTRGSPADDVPLGTFLFKRLVVSETKTTTIELKSFDGPSNTTLGNFVNVVDGGATADVPVATADPLEITLSPPRPPLLAAVCTVVERGDASTKGRISWTSPAGETFPPADYEFRIVVAGETAGTVPATATFFEFTTARVGAVQVSVSAVRKSDGSTAGTATCQVVGVHRPAVTCIAVSSDENRVNWTLSHPVDGFFVYRNGFRIGQTGASGAEFVDRSPSASGGDSYEVAGTLQGTEGPRGSCGPIGDPDTGVTLPPVEVEAALVPRANASAPNTLRFRWRNGEGYQKVAILVERAGESTPVVREDIAGTRTEYDLAGDVEDGGVRPHQYFLSLTGWVGTKPSETVRVGPINVPVPQLAVDLACIVDGSGNVRSTWKPVWKGYSSLKLRIEHTRNSNPLEPPRDVPLDLDDTEHVATGLSPVGVYDFRLIAAYTDPLPEALKPSAESLQQSCRLSFDPRVLVGRVEVGVGMQEAEIPVRADVLGVVNGFHFEIEYPSFFEVDPVTGLVVDHAGADIDTFTIQNGSRPDTKKATVTVTGINTTPDADGDGEADGHIVLARLIGKVPPDFGLSGEKDLRFAGMTTLHFPGTLNTPVVAEDGKLVVVRRFVVLDRREVSLGSSEIVTLSVKGTFNAPSSAPNYRLNAFTIHLRWDPKVLEPILAREDDQRDTVVYKRGSFFLPNDLAIATARITGELKASWIGIDFANPTVPQFLNPGIDMRLLNVKFRSKLAADKAPQFAAVDFVSDPGADNPTAFFPEVDVPTDPDLEGFFGGGIDLVSGQGGDLSIQSISPSRGSLLGRNEAVITGAGFPSGGVTPRDLTVRFERSGGTPISLDVPQADLLEVTASRIRVRVPDSSLRGTSPASTAFTLKVLAGSRTAALTNAYSYDAPRVTGADVSEGRASGGEVVAILGAGLPPPPLSTVAFRVPGVQQPFAVQVDSASADGSRLLILTPDLRGHESKTAVVEVTVKDVATVNLPGGFRILEDGGSATLKLTSVAPARGTICGGLTVTLTGDGFLPNLRVLFGTIPASSVELVDARTARAVTPSVPEGTAAVTVAVSNTTGPQVTKTNGFTFEHPAPPFLRGDVNGDGALGIADAVVLSDIVVGKSATLPANLDAADANDDGALDGGDVVALMEALFAGSGPLPAPRPPSPPGLDPTPDAITSCP